MMTRCGVVIGVVELALEARLAIPDFWAYKTSRLRAIPKGSPATGSPAQRALKQDDGDDIIQPPKRFPQRVRPLKGH